MPRKTVEPRNAEPAALAFIPRSAPMTRYMPGFADRAVPRYTSYPTAAEFTAAVGFRHQIGALRTLPPGMPVSLYVHIPYCREICFYCACNTGRIGAPERLERYVETVMREASLMAEHMRARVVSMHFGGGSPNALDPGQFERLVAHLRTTFACTTSPEIAVELDPRTLDRPYAEALARAGVTRASLGVQTFAPHIQRVIGRWQPYERVFEAVGDLRHAGIGRVSLDLMYGLPHQSIDDIRETISAALQLQPDRISMFGYAHVPSIQPRQRAIDASTLPDGETRFAQSELAFSLLTRAGFSPIGFDHFARPGDPLAHAAATGRLRRNFQGFTDEPGQAVLGLGASAISQFEGLLVQNHKHEGAYRKAIMAGDLAGCRGVVRTADDRMRGQAIERLLCDGAVDLDAIAGEYGRQPQAFASALPRLSELDHAGLIEQAGWTVRITALGRPYARLAASAFDSARDGSAGQFSRAI